MISGAQVRPATAVPTALVVAIAAGVLTWALLGGGYVAVSFALATVVQVIALRACAGAWPLPSLIVVGVLNGVGCLGYYFWDDVRDVAQVAATLPGSAAMVDTGWPLFLGASIASSAGACLVYLLRPRAAGGVDWEAARRVQLRPGLLLLAGIGPLLILIWGKGSALMYSLTYLANDGPRIAVSVGNSLTIASLFMLAVAVMAFRGGVRLLAVLGLAGWAVVLFATATRQIALIPGALLLASYLAPQRRRVGVGWYLVVGATTLALMHLALELRSGTAGFGLDPFVAQVAARPGHYLIPDVGSVFGNVLFAVPLAGYVSTSAALDGHILSTSLSPLLGGMTDWAVVVQGLRVNNNTPYNALGELGAYGWPVLVTFFFVTGAAFAWVELTARKTPGLLGFVATIGVVGLASLFALDSLQYTLRSTARIAYYALALLLVVRLARSEVTESR